MINKNKKVNLHALVGCLIALTTCLGGFVSATTSLNINISLTVYNTFSGSVTLLTTGFSSGGITYLTQTGIDLQISATDTSTWDIMGDLLTPMSGDGVGIYTTNISPFLSDGDGPKAITGIFFKGTEFLYPTPLSLYLDTTAPTIPLGITPFLAETISTSNVTFNRSPSTDAGAGLKEYHLYISESPSFTDPLVFTSTSTTVIVPSNDLPLGIIYWYVDAQDNVGFKTASFPLYFTRQRDYDQGARNVYPDFIWEDPEIEVTPTTEEPVEPESPRYRSPRWFTREIWGPFLEAYTYPVPVGEYPVSTSTPTDIEVPKASPTLGQAPQIGGAAQPIYTKNPKYPVIDKKIIKNRIKELLEQFKSKNSHELTQEEIEQIKEKLASSESPIKDYIKEVLPYEIEKVVEERPGLDPAQVWKYLIAVYEQLPDTPFQGDYIEALTTGTLKIPLLVMILWLHMLCYDIETCRDRIYTIGALKTRYSNPKKMVPKTGQVKPPPV